jgi:3-isopropylmalate/(R)-2-methylmalate dehydratase small subunit
MAKAFKFGNDIDTDAIIPAVYLVTTDPAELGAHAMEGSTQPDFAQNVATGDVVVAGANFGCGSSREHAPVALVGAGVSCVIARSFARIFFRNAINIGLPVMEVADLEADDGDELRIDLAEGTVENLTKGTTHRAAAMPQVMIDVLAEGGLVAYLKKNGTYDESAL